MVERSTYMRGKTPLAEARSLDSTSHNVSGGGGVIVVRGYANGALVLVILERRMEARGVVVVVVVACVFVCVCVCV